MPTMASRTRLWRTTAVTICLFAATLSATSAAHAAQRAGSTPGCAARPWMNPALAPLARARALVDAMTVSEKVAQTHGDATATNFRVVTGIPSLCIPPFTEADGPAGVAGGATMVASTPATALPAPIALASSWDPAAASAYGTVISTEAAVLGRDAVLGPNLDLARTPLNGRTFEGYGEDPVLDAAIGTADVRAIQAHGVMAVIKHLAGYNQESGRYTNNALIGLRTLQELYLAPYKHVLSQGHAAGVMCSYSRLNGVAACQDPFLLTTVLRHQWGFTGFVESDFWANHSSSASANAGLDLEMPSPAYFAGVLSSDVAAGRVTVRTLNAMLTDRYAQMFKFGLFDHRLGGGVLPAAADARAATTIAEQGSVLLRDQGALLPLHLASLHRIAVIGAFASRATTGGGALGSSYVLPIRSVSPLQGIESRVGAAATVVSSPTDDPSAGAAAATGADVAVVVVGDVETEGADRTTLALSGTQDALVEAVAAANPHTVVVVHAGGPVLMPWTAKVGAILDGWYPGGQDGAATAALLFGDVSPGGRLPITFPATAAAGPLVTKAQYPGVAHDITYAENLENGYRWYLDHNVQPLFPFGFGLSYTSFVLGHLAAPSSVARTGTMRISVTVANTGARPGNEVVQLYVGDPPSLGEPVLQLRAFANVSIDPGATSHVQLTFPASALATWSASTGSFVVHPGTYRVRVGTSSEDLPLVAAVHVR